MVPQWRDTKLEPSTVLLSWHVRGHDSPGSYFEATESVDV
jgi:hypothetical protein